MARKNLESGENTGVFRQKLNDNFIELYSNISSDNSVRSLTGMYNSVYTTVNSNSATWNNVSGSNQINSEIISLSSKWQDSFIITSSLSANWDSVYTSVKDTSANWDSVYSTYNKNSSEYTKYEYLNNNFLPLSGGTVTGITQFNNNVTIWGVLSATGGTYFANTIYSTTSAISVVHIGNGPALYVAQKGTGDIASFYDLDQNIEVFHIGGENGDYPNIGVKTSTPNVDFTVNGSISSNNTIYDNLGNSTQWNSGFTTINKVSANWDSVYTSVKDTSANWDSVYSSVNSNSGTYATISFTDNKFLPLSGGIINGDLTITGNLSSLGTNTQIDTLIFVTSAVSITNVGTGPALTVRQTGSQDIVNFFDDSNTAFIIKDGGNVGINTPTPNQTLTVSGNISATGVISASGSNISVNVVNTTNHRTFSNGDNNRIFHFNTSLSSLSASFPTSLSNGFNAVIMNTGTNSLIISAANLNSAGTTIATRFGGAFVYKDSDNVFAVGRLT